MIFVFSEIPHEPEERRGEVLYTIPDEGILHSSIDIMLTSTGAQICLFNSYGDAHLMKSSSAARVKQSAERSYLYLVVPGFMRLGTN